MAQDPAQSKKQPSLDDVKDLLETKKELGAGVPYEGIRDSAGFAESQGVHLAKLKDAEKHIKALENITEKKLWEVQGFVRDVRNKLTAAKSSIGSRMVYQKAQEKLDELSGRFSRIMSQIEDGGAKELGDLLQKALLADIGSGGESDPAQTKSTQSQEPKPAKKVDSKEDKEDRKPTWNRGQQLYLSQGRGAAVKVSVLKTYWTGEEGHEMVLITDGLVPRLSTPQFLSEKTRSKDIRDKINDRKHPVIANGYEPKVGDILEYPTKVGKRKGRVVEIQTGDTNGVTVRELLQDGSDSSRRDWRIYGSSLEDATLAESAPEDTRSIAEQARILSEREELEVQYDFEIGDTVFFRTHKSRGSTDFYVFQGEVVDIVQPKSGEAAVYVTDGVDIKGIALHRVRPQLPSETSPDEVRDTFRQYKTYEIDGKQLKKDDIIHSSSAKAQFQVVRTSKREGPVLRLLRGRYGEWKGTRRASAKQMQEILEDAQLHVEREPVKRPQLENEDLEDGHEFMTADGDIVRVLEFNDNTGKMRLGLIEDGEVVKTFYKNKKAFEEMLKGATRDLSEPIDDEPDIVPVDFVDDDGDDEATVEPYTPPIDTRPARFTEPKDFDEEGYKRRLLATVDGLRGMMGILVKKDASYKEVQDAFETRVQTIESADLDALKDISAALDELKPMLFASDPAEKMLRALKVSHRTPDAGGDGPLWDQDQIDAVKAAPKKRTAEEIQQERLDTIRNIATKAFDELQKTGFEHVQGRSLAIVPSSEAAGVVVDFDDEQVRISEGLLDADSDLFFGDEIDKTPFYHQAASRAVNGRPSDNMVHGELVAHYGLTLEDMATTDRLRRVGDSFYERLDDEQVVEKLSGFIRDEIERKIAAQDAVVKRTKDTRDEFEKALGFDTPAQEAEKKAMYEVYEKGGVDGYTSYYERGLEAARDQGVTDTEISDDDIEVKVPANLQDPGLQGSYAEGYIAAAIKGYAQGVKMGTSFDEEERKKREEALAEQERKEAEELKEKERELAKPVVDAWKVVRHDTRKDVSFKDRFASQYKGDASDIHPLEGETYIAIKAPEESQFAWYVVPDPIYDHNMNLVARRFVGEDKEPLNWDKALHEQYLVTPARLDKDFNPEVHELMDWERVVKGEISDKEYIFSRAEIDFMSAQLADMTRQAPDTQQSDIEDKSDPVTPPSPPDTPAEPPPDPVVTSSPVVPGSAADLYSGSPVVSGEKVEEVLAAVKDVQKAADDAPDVVASTPATPDTPPAVAPATPVAGEGGAGTPPGGEPPAGGGGEGGGDDGEPPEESPEEEDETKVLEIPFLDFVYNAKTGEFTPKTSDGPATKAGIDSFSLAIPGIGPPVMHTHPKGIYWEYPAVGTSFFISDVDGKDEIFCAARIGESGANFDDIYDDPSLSGFSVKKDPDSGGIEVSMRDTFENFKNDIIALFKKSFPLLYEYSLAVEDMKRADTPVAGIIGALGLLITPDDCTLRAHEEKKDGDKKKDKKDDKKKEATKDMGGDPVPLSIGQFVPRVMIRTDGLSLHYPRLDAHMYFEKSGENEVVVRNIWLDNAGDPQVRMKSFPLGSMTKGADAIRAIKMTLRDLKDEIRSSGAFERMNEIVGGDGSFVSDPIVGTSEYVFASGEKLSLVIPELGIPKEQRGPTGPEVFEDVSYEYESGFGIRFRTIKNPWYDDRVALQVDEKLPGMGVSAQDAIVTIDPTEPLETKAELMELYFSLFVEKATKMNTTLDEADTYMDRQRQEAFAAGEYLSTDKIVHLRIKTIAIRKEIADLEAIPEADRSEFLNAELKKKQAQLKEAETYLKEHVISEKDGLKVLTSSDVIYISSPNNGFMCHFVELSDDTLTVELFDPRNPKGGADGATLLYLKRDDFNVGNLMATRITREKDELGADELIVRAISKEWSTIGLLDQLDESESLPYDEHEIKEIADIMRKIFGEDLYVPYGGEVASNNFEREQFEDIQRLFGLLTGGKSVDREMRYWFGKGEREEDTSERMLGKERFKKRLEHAAFLATLDEDALDEVVGLVMRCADDTALLTEFSMSEDAKEERFIELFAELLDTYEDFFKQKKDFGVSDLNAWLKTAGIDLVIKGDPIKIDEKIRGLSVEQVRKLAQTEGLPAVGDPQEDNPLGQLMRRIIIERRRVEEERMYSEEQQGKELRAREFDMESKILDLKASRNALIKSIVAQLNVQGRVGVGHGTRARRKDKDKEVKKKEQEKEKALDRYERAQAGEDLEPAFVEQTVLRRMGQWIAASPRVVTELVLGKSFENGYKTEKKRHSAQESYEKKLVDVVERSRLRAQEIAESLEAMSLEAIDKTLEQFDSKERANLTGKIKFWVRKLSSINLYDAMSKKATQRKNEKLADVRAAQKGEDMSEPEGGRGKLRVAADKAMQFAWEGFGLPQALGKTLNRGSKSEKIVRALGKVGGFARWGATRMIDSRTIAAGLLIGQGGMALAMPEYMHTGLGIVGTGIGAKVVADRMADIFGYFKKKNRRDQALVNTEDIEAQAQEYAVSQYKDIRMKMEAAMDKNEHNREDLLFEMLDDLQEYINQHFYRTVHERFGWIKRDEFEEFIKEDLENIASALLNERLWKTEDEFASIDLKEGTSEEIEEKEKRVDALVRERLDVLYPGAGFDLAMEGIKNRLLEELVALKETDSPTIHMEHVLWQVTQAKREIDKEESKLTMLRDRLRRVLKVQKKIDKDIRHVKEASDEILDDSLRISVDGFKVGKVRTESIKTRAIADLVAVQEELEGIIKDKNLADDGMDKAQDRFDQLSDLVSEIVDDLMEAVVAELNDPTVGSDQEDAELKSKKERFGKYVDELAQLTDQLTSLEEQFEYLELWEDDVRDKAEKLRRHLVDLTNLENALKKKEDDFKAIQKRLAKIEEDRKIDLAPLADLYKKKANLERERRHIKDKAQEYISEQMNKSNLLTGTPSERYEKIHQKIDAIVSHEISFGDVNTLKDNAYFQSLKKAAQELAFDALVDSQLERLADELTEKAGHNLPSDFKKNKDRRDPVFFALSEGDIETAAQLMIEWVQEDLKEKEEKRKGMKPGALARRVADRVKDELAEQGGDDERELKKKGLRDPRNVLSHEKWEETLSKLDIVKIKGDMGKDGRKRVVDEIMKHHEDHVKERASMVDQKRFWNGIRRWGAIAGTIPLAQIIGPYTESMHVWASKVPEAFHKTGDVAKWIADLGDLAVDGWHNWEMFGDNPPYEFHKPVRPAVDDFFTADTPLEAGKKVGLSILGARYAAKPILQTAYRAAHRGFNHVWTGPMTPIRKVFKKS